MTALQALQQARLDTSKYARPKQSIGEINMRFIKNNDQKKSRWINFTKSGVHYFYGMIPLAHLVNPDGSPVEWEVVSESEL